MPVLYVLSVQIAEPVRRIRPGLPVAGVSRGLLQHGEIRAELLIHQVAEVAEHLEELSMRIQQGAYMLLDLERRRLETLQTRIPNLVHRKLADARFSLLAAKKDLSQVTKALVARQSHRLELLQQRIADASPDKLLSRGYSITIKDGKAVTDASLLKPGEHLITRLSKGEVRSVVEK